MSRIFISYRRGDSAGHTGRLFDTLEGRFGREAFFRDIEDLDDPGADFRASIDRALSQCNTMLVMIGPDWASATAGGQRRLQQADDLVRIEVATALARSEEVRTIPVLVGGATMPTVEDLPEDLRSLLGKSNVEISDTRWDYDVGRLADALARRLGLEEAGPSPAPPTPAQHTPAPARKGGGMLRIGAGVAIALVALYLFFSMLEEETPEEGLGADASAWQAQPPVAAGGTAPRAAASASNVGTFDVAGLTWTTDDRDEIVDWSEASAYCENLRAGGRSWRLPTCDELETIANPDDADAFGQKLMRPFHDGVNSNWIWSQDIDTAGAAFAFDFDGLAPVSLAMNFDEGATALCVSD